jgi:hypothetical protein
MTIAKWCWLQRDRRTFVEMLAETGDPALAAHAVGRDVADAFHMRDKVPEFAAAWQRALGIAWERVEMRVLAGLLATGKAADDKPGRLIDSRMALAMLQRREAPKSARGGTAPVDGPQVMQLRDEIRALATTLPDDWTPPR